MRITEESVQREQRERYENWVRSEGGVEKVVHAETYEEPAQVERTKWLVKQVEDLPLINGKRVILELGVSGGHQLLAMQGQAGVDINPEIIQANYEIHPDMLWIQADVTKGGWDLALPRFDCVTIPDLIEHLEFHQIPFVIRKAKQLAKHTVLITTPDGRERGKNIREVCCFKHRVIITESKFNQLLGVCRETGWQVKWETVGPFLCVRLDK